MEPRIQYAKTEDGASEVPDGLSSGAGVSGRSGDD